MSVSTGMDRLFVIPRNIVHNAAITVMAGSKCVKNNLGRSPSSMGQLLRQHPLPDRTVFITSVFGVVRSIDCKTKLVFWSLDALETSWKLPTTQGNIRQTAIAVLEKVCISNMRLPLF